MLGRPQYLTLGAAFFVAGVLSLSSSSIAAAVQTETGGEKLEIGESQPGNYLSALIASADRDTPAAEVYYREALQVDPRNPYLLERAFAAALSTGTRQLPVPSANGSLRATLITALPVSRWQFAISNRDNSHLRGPI